MQNFLLGQGEDGSPGPKGLPGSPGRRGPRGPPGPFVVVPPGGGPDEEGGPDPLTISEARNHEGNLLYLVVIAVTSKT